jgi:hypothetical protein
VRLQALPLALALILPLAPPLALALTLALTPPLALALTLALALPGSRGGSSSDSSSVGPVAIYVWVCYHLPSQAILPQIWESQDHSPEISSISWNLNHRPLAVNSLTLRNATRQS